MLKRFALLTEALFFLFLFAACSSSSSAIQNKPQESASSDFSGNQGQDSSNTQANKNEIKKLMQAAFDKNLEIPVKRVYHKSYYSLPPRPAGGVWYYTQEDHTGHLEGIARWDREDLIFVQIPDREYYGYSARLVSLKKQGKDIVHITLAMEKGDYVKNDLPPRIIISVDKGSLDPKSVKFRVTTEGGENLMLH